MMRIEVIKCLGAISAGHSCERLWRVSKTAKERICKTSDFLSGYPQPPGTVHTGLAAIFFRGLKTSCISSHLCLASWTEAVGMWVLDGGPHPEVGSSVTLGETGFLQNSLFEAANEESRAVMALACLETALKQHLGGWSKVCWGRESRAHQGK